MTFQRSLYISVAVHLLIFGSAIAAVQFAKGTFLTNRDAITVSLVGHGFGSGGRVSQELKHRVVRSDTGPDRVLRSVTSEKQTSVQPDSKNIPSSQPEEGTGSGAVTVRGSDIAVNTSGNTEYGLISPEQWMIISSALEKSKSYPRMARERGIEGVVRVRFKLKPSGDVERVEIAKSSGYDILDTASIRTVYRASPMPYVNGWVEVPMAYVLK